VTNDEFTAGSRGFMPLIEHLRELRRRATLAVLALVIGTLIGYLLFPRILVYLIAPYCDLPSTLRASGECGLIALRPLEPFSVRIRTALVVGLFVSGPVLFLQIWRFITPGLTTQERRFALPFVLISQALFAAGIGFAYLIIPRALAILLSLGGPLVTPMLSATEYLSFFLAMSLAFGVIFEIPLVLISLTLTGILNAQQLRTARPYAVVGMTIASAIITPTTDAVTLLFVAGPMWFFYEFSVIIARLIGRRRERTARTEA
jgi:sec-independent protein translocase protein TatC